jgi:hypothetical protein
MWGGSVLLLVLAGVCAAMDIAGNADGLLYMAALLVVLAILAAGTAMHERSSDRRIAYALSNRRAFIIERPAKADGKPVIFSFAVHPQMIFKYLRRGTRGKILNVFKSVDFDELFSGNVIINVSRLSGSKDKALIMSMLMQALYEYRISCYVHDAEYRRKAQQNRLMHLTLIEEAHNVLMKPDSNATSRKNPINRFICNLPFSARTSHAVKTMQTKHKKPADICRLAKSYSAASTAAITPETLSVLMVSMRPES